MSQYLQGTVKFIRSKYSKHWLSTATHKCSEISNHGLNHGRSIGNMMGEMGYYFHFSSFFGKNSF